MCQNSPPAPKLQHNVGKFLVHFGLELIPYEPGPKPSRAQAGPAGGLKARLDFGVSPSSVKPSPSPGFRAEPSPCITTDHHAAATVYTEDDFDAALAEGISEEEDGD